MTKQFEPRVEDVLMTRVDKDKEIDDLEDTVTRWEEAVREVLAKRRRETLTSIRGAREKSTGQSRETLFRQRRLGTVQHATSSNHSMMRRRSDQRLVASVFWTTRWRCRERQSGQQDNWRKQLWLPCQSAWSTRQRPVGANIQTRRTARRRRAS